MRNGLIIVFVEKENRFVDNMVPAAVNSVSEKR
jgi:hypothetical protein